MNFKKKLLLIALISGIGISGCRQEDDYKHIRKEVIDLHDEVMSKNDLLVGQEMRIDTLLRNLDSLKRSNTQMDTVTERKNLASLLEALQSAEESMNSWMHNFEPDTKGKSDKESADYFKGEKRKIKQVDSLYEVRTKQAAEYLSRFK